MTNYERRLELIERVRAAQKYRQEREAIDRQRHEDALRWDVCEHHVIGLCVQCENDYADAADESREPDWI